MTKTMVVSAAFRTSLTQELANGNGNGRAPTALLRTALYHVGAVPACAPASRLPVRGWPTRERPRTTRLMFPCRACQPVGSLGASPHRSHRHANIPPRLPAAFRIGGHGARHGTPRRRTGARSALVSGSGKGAAAVQRTGVFRQRTGIRTNASADARPGTPSGEAWRKRHSTSTTGAPVAEIEDYAAGSGRCYRLHADGAAEHQPSLACARNAALELIQSRARRLRGPAL
jgi:hypothetical protein